MLSFDSAYYLAKNPEIAALGVSPQAHYERIGYLEGRDPSPYFDTAYYLSENPDVLVSGQNPFTHFNTVGAFEGRNPSAQFDVAYVMAMGESACDDAAMCGAAAFETSFYTLGELSVFGKQHEVSEAIVVASESVLEDSDIDNDSLEELHFFNALVASYATSLIAVDALEEDEAEIVSLKVSSGVSDEVLGKPVSMLMVVGEAASKQLLDDALLRPVASNDNDEARPVNFAVHQNLYVPKSMRVSMGNMSYKDAVHLGEEKSHHHDPTKTYWHGALHAYASYEAGVQPKLGMSISSTYPYDKLIA
jgi:hypothetical protein